MPFQEASSQIEPLLFQMKQYKNLTKSTIEILPSSGQTDYTAHRRCIFTLPYASLISLEDLAFHFEFHPISPELHQPVGGNGEPSPVYRVLPPKDVASLIAEIDIKINGQTIQHLTRYNDIVNLLNTFERPGTAKNVLQGFNPGYRKQRGDNGQHIELAGVDYTLNTAATPPAVIPFKKNVHQKYVINHWYGLFGKRGKEVSSNFIDTNMLGEVTIAFVFASPSVCIKSQGTLREVQAAGGQTLSLANTPTTTAPFWDDNGATPPVITAAGTANKLAYEAWYNATQTNTGYIIKNAKMSMVRYNLPGAYSEAVRSHLSNGSPYQIAFNHYEIHSANCEANSGNLRWNENSRDIKGLLAFFNNTNRDTGTGSDYNEAVNSSAYFVYDNPIHHESQFQIGSVKMPQNKLNTIDCFLELTRGLPGVRGNNTDMDLSYIQHNLQSTVEGWTEKSFMAYLSLEWTEGMTDLANDGKKLLSGLSSEQLPISCVYFYDNDQGFRGATAATQYKWNKSVNVMSLTTRLLVIENGQNVHVEI